MQMNVDDQMVVEESISNTFQKSSAISKGKGLGCGLQKNLMLRIRSYPRGEDWRQSSLGTIENHDQHLLNAKLIGGKVST